MSNLLSSLTPAQLRHAADLKEKIGAFHKELASILGATVTKPAKAPAKGKMSAAGRARIAAAQKARWAKVKEAKPAAKSIKPAPVKKRTMSVAAKAKLAALAKARWAKVKAAGKKSL